MRVTIDKVEKLVERADVSYEAAKEALEAADGNMLDAVIALEKEGRLGPNAGKAKAAAYSTGTGTGGSAVGETYGAGSLPQVWVDPNFTMGGGEAGGAKKGGKGSRGAKSTGGSQEAGGAYSQGQSYYQGQPYNQGGGRRAYKDESTAFEDGAMRFFRWVGRVFRASVLNFFEINRKGERIMAIPVLLFLFCLIRWVFWVVLILLIVGLCCGFRYSFSGPHLGRKDVNDVMDKASDFVDELKKDDDAD